MTKLNKFKNFKIKLIKKYQLIFKVNYKNQIANIKNINNIINFYNI